ncbi:ORF32 protein [Operophtera brumata nucleopolyhedrovirus]|uniref:ORF32 protein n=1 Tax=Operophtera brumata nucleopolyhedrovirus TaxID=1046267 RepID=A0A2H4UZN4_9ABAC|nr:ORF32 protein [Operophtera brumata nucleopolyhedrovirus]AUA60263.1 ORF32 protein [Operophtera brumata nucleopolyhedrovirus]
MAASTQNLHFTYFGNNPEYLKRARLVEPEVFKQIDMLSNIGVTGVITGGFAAYITGYTKEYRDVDLFSADHHLRHLLSDDYEILTDKHSYVEKTYVVYNHKLTKLQVIFIENKDVLKPVDAFLFECVKNFDMTISKKAFFTNKDVYFCIDTSYEEDKKPVTDERVDKYAIRILHHGTADSLKSVALRANFKS